MPAEIPTFNRYKRSNKRFLIADTESSYRTEIHVFDLGNVSLFPKLLKDRSNLARTRAYRYAYDFLGRIYPLERKNE